MQLNTLVGPQTNNADGTQPSVRGGKQGDVIVSELHGRYYESNYRGFQYFTGHTAVAALSANTITLTATTTPILGVWNPVGSGQNLVMQQAFLSLFANNLTSGAGPGALVWATSLNNASISTGLTPIRASTLAASGSVAKGFAGATALTGLTNNLAIVAGANFPSPTGLTYTTLASTALLTPFNGREDFDGAIIVPPGGVLALLNTTSSTVFSAVGRLHWEEVPV